MDTRVAIIAIVVEDTDMTEELNQILHQYASYIVGRMGIPYNEKNISLISIMVDAPMDEIGALSGKIGMLKGITARVVYASV